MALLQGYGYLKIHYNAKVINDPSYPKIDHAKFTKADWTEFHGNVKEAVPPNAPEPKGMLVQITI